MKWSSKSWHFPSSPVSYYSVSHKAMMDLWSEELLLREIYSFSIFLTAFSASSCICNTQTVPELIFSFQRQQTSIRHKLIIFEDVHAPLTVRKNGVNEMGICQFSPPSFEDPFGSIRWKVWSVDKEDIPELFSIFQPCLSCWKSLKSRDLRQHT